MALLCCRGTGRPVNCRSAIAYMSEESGDIFHIRFSGQFVHNHGISRELVDVLEYSPLAFTSYLLPLTYPLQHFSRFSLNIVGWEDRASF